MTQAASMDRQKKVANSLRKYLNRSPLSSLVRSENTKETMTEKMVKAAKWLINDRSLLSTHGDIIGIENDQHVQ